MIDRSPELHHDGSLIGSMLYLYDRFRKGIARQSQASAGVKMRYSGDNQGFDVVRPQRRIDSRYTEYGLCLATFCGFLIFFLLFSRTGRGGRGGRAV